MLRTITAVIRINFLKPEVKVLFYSMLSGFFRNIIAFGKVPQLLPFVHLVIETCRWRWAWSTGGMILTEEDRSTSIKPIPVPLWPSQT